MHPNFSVSSPQSHFSTWWPDMATQMVGYLLVRGEAPLYYNQGPQACAVYGSKMAN